MAGPTPDLQAQVSHLTWEIEMLNMDIRVLQTDVTWLTTQLKRMQVEPARKVKRERRTRGPRPDTGEVADPG